MAGTGVFFPRSREEMLAAKPDQAQRSSGSTLTCTSSSSSSTTRVPRRSKAARAAKQANPSLGSSPGGNLILSPLQGHPGAAANSPPGQISPVHGKALNPCKQQPMSVPPPPPPPRPARCSNSAGVLQAAAAAWQEGAGSRCLDRAGAGAVADTSFESWVDGDSSATLAGMYELQVPAASAAAQPAAAAAAGHQAATLFSQPLAPAAAAGFAEMQTAGFRSSRLLTGHVVIDMGQSSGNLGVGQPVKLSAAGQCSSSMFDTQQQQQLWPGHAAVDVGDCSRVQSAPVENTIHTIGALQLQQLQLQLQQQQQQQLRIGPEQQQQVLLLRPVSPGEAVSAELAAATCDAEQTLSFLRQRLAAARTAAAAGDADLASGPWACGSYSSPELLLLQQQLVRVSDPPGFQCPAGLVNIASTSSSANMFGCSLSSPLGASPVTLGVSPTSALESASGFASVAGGSVGIATGMLGGSLSALGSSMSVGAMLSGSGTSQLQTGSGNLVPSAGGAFGVGGPGNVSNSGELFAVGQEGCGDGEVGGSDGAAAQHGDVGELAAVAAQQKLQQMAALEALHNQLRQDVASLLPLI